MKFRILSFHNIFFLIVLIVCLAPVVSAQLISIKTAPVATGDQFLLYPSQNLGMGGVSIAINDTLYDPFVNPAKGGRMRGAMLFGAPTFYSISKDQGAARTLPLGILYASQGWFAGGALSLQQLDMVSPERTVQLLSEKFSTNIYMSGFLGKKLPQTQSAIGMSFFWADLTGMDGVDILYPRSRDLVQYGHIVDLRVGFINDRDGERQLDLVLLHHRVNMTHDVTYEDWMWDESLYCSIPFSRKEKNLDRSNTWGIHLGYQRPLARSDWRWGFMLTGNWKTHPKIPNYELMNIPRDPGNSIAYNFGVGLSQKRGRATFGIDMIYEPIWSDTWAEAAERLEIPGGKIIYPGDKTVENHFEFSNAILRMGIHQRGRPLGFQLGLQMRAIRYGLDQTNHAEAFQRNQHEHWLEWTVSLGLLLNFETFHIRYLARVTHGTGLPGVVRGDFRSYNAVDEMSDFLIAPSGPMTLDGVHVFTHQIGIVIPIE